MKKKKEKTPTYQVTYEQIRGYIQQGYERGFKKGKEETIELATKYSMAVPLMALRDEFGFGQKRLLQFYESFMDLYDSIEKGYLTIEDIVKTINEETDIEIVDK